MISSADFFEEISSDRLHGASQVYSKFLSLFLTYLQHVDKVDEKFIRELPQAIVKVRSDMAPFFYAALRVSGLAEALGKSGDPLKGQLTRLVEELKAEQGEAISKIIENVRPMAEKASSVMLHSSSGTVMAIIKDCLPEKTRFFVSEASPDREGEKLAEGLASQGYEVTLFPDDARYRYVKAVDLVLLGSDWVAEDGFVNKIGTNCLALAAVNENKPLVVAADGSKLVPSKFLHMPKPSRVRLARNLYREVCVFEAVDNNLVDRFVTDVGTFSSSELAAFVKTRLSYVNFTLK